MIRNQNFKRNVVQILCMTIVLLIFTSAAYASPSVSGKWLASWMNSYLYLQQDGQKVTGTFRDGGTLSGTLSGNVLTGRWYSSANAQGNEFQFVFSDNGNYITGGYWDRGRGYAYTRSSIKGYRDGVKPN